MLFLFFSVMAFKKEKRTSVWLEAQRILRESLKVPQLSNNFAEVVDNFSPASVPVFLIPEDKRGSVLPDGGDQLVKEPEIFAGSRDVVVDAGELRIADPVVNSGPGVPVAELTAGGESEVGTLATGQRRTWVLLICCGG